MCGRFTLGNPEKITERFDIKNTLPNFPPSYNITPGQMTPVITRESPNKVILMKWGLIPFWAKDPRIGYKMINARSEGLENKPAFRKPIRVQRCLVPSDGFYEWKSLNLEGKKEKFPWYLGLKNQELFVFAGLYDSWKDAEGKETLSYTIITTTPNSLLETIYNRMPVILKKKDEDTWLDKKSEITSILNLLKPYPEKDMVGYPVSKRVNNPENDDVSLIEKTHPGI